MKYPFALERYLLDLHDQTAWAPDYPIENLSGPIVPRPALYRMAHLWTLALLDDRFDTLLLPILVTTTIEAIVNRSPAWQLSPAFFHERLESGACLLFLDGQPDEAARWPQNRAILTTDY